MQIAVVFHFEEERHPCAVTEVEGDVTDVLLPQVGDTVAQTDLDGRRFRAEVIARHFEYDLHEGEGVDGRITVVLSLKRMEMSTVQ